VAARGRGIAPAAVRAVTAWVFDAFAGTSLRQIMLVHDVGNPASCRVAQKAGYPFRELSPANPPRWLTDGHIHMRLGGGPGPTADAQQGTTLSVRPGTTSRSAVSPVTCLQRRSRLVTAELKSGARYRRIFSAEGRGAAACYPYADPPVLYACRRANALTEAERARVWSHIRCLVMSEPGYIPTGLPLQL
jgi:hypothetical protein